MTTQSKEVAVAKQSNITDSVLKKVNEFQALGELKIPSGYSPENALKSAYLVLLETETRDKKPVLQACTKESIANALLNMVVQGLSPMKQQCAFVSYGNKLTLQRQYQGTIALAKRYGGVKEVTGNVVYEGDKFQYEINHETGKKKVTLHEQSLSNIDGKIIGAYATIVNEDGSIESEIMTRKQIEAAWAQGATKGASPAHKNFPDQMCIKTVINRACKLKIQSSDDSVLGLEDEEKDYIVESSREEIQQKANQEEVTFDEVEEVEFDTNTDQEESVTEEVTESNEKVIQNGQTAGPNF